MIHPGNGQGSGAAIRSVATLTEPASADLVALNSKNLRAVRGGFKKMLLLERDPQVGLPLRGGLNGYRKLTVSDNT